MADEKNKALESIAEELTPFTREFIFNLVHGKSASGNPLTVYEAYQKAGGEGSKHAAYQLKSRLEKFVMQEEINRGASKADIFKQIADLMELPVTNRDGSPAVGMSVTNKIKLLQVAVKAQESLEPAAPKITAFTIIMPPAAKATAPVVDVEPIEGDSNAS